MALHAVLPFPEIEAISQKLRFFAAHKDEFDTLFIGSSRIYFQVSPAVFDDVTRGNGNPTHSFNFGIGGMHLPESAYVLEQVLKTKPRHLRWVFMELGELQIRWPHQVEGSRRALYWHDWRRTALVLRKILDAGTRPIWLPNVKKLRDVILTRKAHADTRTQLIFHAAQFEKSLANIARASDIADYFLWRQMNKHSADYLGPSGDGYVARAGGMSATQTAAYERALALVMTQNGGRCISPYTAEACRQSAEKIRGIGAVPILLLPPSVTRLKADCSSSTQSLGIVMAFNDPRAYPNLYRSGVRRDEEHMTKTGAEEFTRLMAADFARLVQAGKIK